MQFLVFTDVDVKVITVASDETEGYQRFIRSAQYFNIEVSPKFLVFSSSFLIMLTVYTLSRYKH